MRSLQKTCAHASMLTHAASMHTLPPRFVPCAAAMRRPVPPLHQLAPGGCCCCRVESCPKNNSLMAFRWWRAFGLTTKDNRLATRDIRLTTYTRRRSRRSALLHVPSLLVPLYSRSNSNALAMPPELPPPLDIYSNHSKTSILREGLD